MNRWGALALVLAILAALALRVPQLDLRPLHNDEGVNALKLAALWQGGNYRYDPHEYHGPTLHYFSLPFLKLAGVRDPAHLTDTVLRIAPVFFGVAILLLLPLLTDGLGRRAVAIAAGLTALSPAMVFYSRYFIHETLLVFFTLLAIGGGWRYVQTRKLLWAGVTGLGVGLMYATKETFVLALAAMGFGVVATIFWETWRERALATDKAATEQAGFLPSILRKVRGLMDRRAIGVAVLAGAVVSVPLFTSLFTNWRGPLDSVLTYLPWLGRAAGDSPHIHPWHFYFERLFWFHPPKSPLWTEAAIGALALFGAVVSLAGNRRALVSPRLGRFLTFYTIALAGCYTIIPYKTPWCLLGFLHGMILLAGIGAAGLFDWRRGRALPVALGLALGAAGGHLAWQAGKLSTEYAADRRNPYVYAQTVPGIHELVARVEAIAQVHPESHAMVVKVISPESYWPLPWYLRAFQRVGWWEQLPDDPFAPVMLVAARLHAQLDERTDKRWLMTGLYEIRPGVFLELYVETELWKEYIARRPRPVDLDEP